MREKQSVRACVVIAKRPLNLNATFDSCLQLFHTTFSLMTPTDEVGVLRGSDAGINSNVNASGSTERRVSGNPTKFQPHR